MPPLLSATDQATAVSVEPVTVALNESEPSVELSARSGEIKTRTSGGGALTTTVAVAVFVGSAFAVATT